MTLDIAAHIEAARIAWPSLRFEEDDYALWLCDALLAFDEPAKHLATLDAGSVALCWNAARGDPEAHRLFESHIIPHVAPALSRLYSNPDFIDEVAQRVRLKLLVAKPGELAPIANYGLRGSLAGLVRVAAVREAFNARRAERPIIPIQSIEQLVGEQDPALRALKVRYAVDFERAFAAAVAELSVRDRQLLRLNLSIKASIDDIARIFHTHRATAARWLIAARDALAVGVRQKLQTALGLPDDELNSLLRLVRSEATRMLASIPPEADE